MTLRVAQWATGAVGAHALGVIAAKPGLELVAAAHNLLDYSSTARTDTAHDAWRAAATTLRERAEGIHRTVDQLRGDLEAQGYHYRDKLREALDHLDKLMRGGDDHA